jgi:hypothetical protein
MCELGWILYCQCVHRWNKWDKVITIKPRWVLQNNKMIQCICIIFMRVISIWALGWICYFQCVLGVLHCWISWDEISLIGLKVLHYNTFVMFMH